MTLKGFAVIILVLLSNNIVKGDGFDEVQEWRRRTGLPLFKEDPKMTKFAKMKASFRAERNLQNSHTGPKPQAGWVEGTGEAKPMWGWLTCAIEDDYTHAGAGLVVGSNGVRYMVFVGRGGTGRPLISSHNIPTYDTSYLTKNPEKVKSPVVIKQRCPKCGRYH